MFSAFLYFLAMAFTIPVLPKVVNELVTGSKAVSTFVESNGTGRKVATRRPPPLRQRKSSTVPNSTILMPLR